MFINLQPTTICAPNVEHRDFPATPQHEAFSTAIITIGADQITIFLPFGGRITYHNQTEQMP